MATSSTATTPLAASCSRSAGKCSTFLLPKSEEGQGGRGPAFRAGAPSGSCKRPIARRHGHRFGEEKDPAAETFYRSNVADSNGNRGKDARREGTFGCDERDRAWYARDPRLHHRGAVEARLYRPGRKESRSDGQGCSSDRGRPRGSEESGDDGTMGGVPQKDPER